MLRSIGGLMYLTRKNVSDELLTEARRQYEHSEVPNDAIAGMLGISTTTFHRWVKKLGWPQRSQRKLSDPVAPDAAPQTPESLALRVQETVERELLAVERILATLGPLPEDVIQAERAARTLASLSRTLREVAKLSAQTSEDRKSADKADDDLVPRDIGELRDVVSRRLAKLVADAKAAHPDERDGA